MKKKWIFIFIGMICLFFLTSCGNTKKTVSMEPEAVQMKAICELAVMDCYYHNVAKFEDEDAEGILWWRKDKNFWIEYGGIVTLGVDASLVTVDVNGAEVVITLPKATVLNCTVDSASLTKESFIVAKDSAEIEAEDELEAFSVAQEYLKKNASEDTVLLDNAQQRVENLLEDYITNIGDAVGKEYSIKWVYLDASDESTE